MSHPVAQAPRLEQFNASYDAQQDRIQLRIRTSDDSEYRLWITRRYLSLLWPMLMKMADEFSAAKAPTDALTRATMAELAHGAAVDTADFSTQFQEGDRFPLGSEPVLLARISLQGQRGDTRTLVLLPAEGSGINLNLDEKLVHILARLLQQTAAAADWALKLDVNPQNSFAAQSSPTRHLH